MKSVCVLRVSEGVKLRKTGKVVCSKHYHVKRSMARLLVLGAKYVPAYMPDNYEPEARWAILPNGKASDFHIVLTDADEWRKVTTRAPFGGLGFAAMQLVSQAHSREEHES